MTTKPEITSTFKQHNASDNSVKKDWIIPEIIFISTDHITAKSQPFAHEKTLQPFPSKPGVLHLKSAPSVPIPAANKSHYLS